MVDFLIAGLFALFLLMLLGRVVLKPVRWAFKLLINSVVGLFVLLVINFIGAPWDFTLPVTFTRCLLRAFGPAGYRPAGRPAPDCIA